jgi:hypothetical protein
VLPKIFVNLCHSEQGGGGGGADLLNAEMIPGAALMIAGMAAISSGAIPSSSLGWYMAMVGVPIKGSRGARRKT